MTEKNEALVEAHGVSPEYTEQQGVLVGRAILIALGAAGRIPAREMDRFVEIATEYGATADMIQGWRRFNYADAELEEQIDMTPRLARHLMYEAIRVVRSVAPPGPCAKLAAAARVLGVSKAVMSALDAIVTAEDALHRMRAAVDTTLAGPDGARPPSATASLHMIAEREGSLRELRIKTMVEETTIAQ